MLSEPRAPGGELRFHGESFTGEGVGGSSDGNRIPACPCGRYGNLQGVFGRVKVPSGAPHPGRGGFGVAMTSTTVLTESFSRSTRRAESHVRSGADEFLRFLLERTGTGSVEAVRAGPGRLPSEYPGNSQQLSG